MEAEISLFIKQFSIEYYMFEHSFLTLQSGHSEKNTIDF